MSLPTRDQKLLEEELASSRARLKRWVTQQLAKPAAQGQGRNNQMIQLAPRMLDLGFDDEAIFEKFKAMYELEGDNSKDEEILRVIERAQAYARPMALEDPEEKARKILEWRAAQRKAAACLKMVMTDFQWPEAQIAREGGCSKMNPAEQREAFLRTMFDERDVLWCGQVHHSGIRRDGRDHSSHFKTMREWVLRVPPPAYEFISHCTFLTGAWSRCLEQVAEQKYLVVESDELSRDEMGAVFSWLRHGGLALRAVVFSGRRSLHGWFDWPKGVERIKPHLVGLKCDPSTTRPSQPVRLAGVKRKDSQLIQALLYLRP